MYDIRVPARSKGFWAKWARIKLSFARVQWHVFLWNIRSNFEFEFFSTYCIDIPISFAHSTAALVKQFLVHGAWFFPFHWAVQCPCRVPVHHLIVAFDLKKQAHISRRPNHYCCKMRARYLNFRLQHLTSAISFCSVVVFSDCWSDDDIFKLLKHNAFAFRESKNHEGTKSWSIPEFLNFYFGLASSPTTNTCYFYFNNAKRTRHSNPLVFT